MNLAEIIQRLRHYADTELPHAQAKNLAVDLNSRRMQLVALIGSDNAGRFVPAIQHLDAARNLSGLTIQRLTACRAAITEATATLR